ncbi:MAG: HEPN domain-containing protein [Planctomycetales bacterium]|nr:HEPN domain-containing protein [Planctomycetales bacterium]
MSEEATTKTWDQNPDFERTVVQNLFDMFVAPEIARRRERGEIPPDFDLGAAQIIFFPDGRAPAVRLNREVQARFQATVAPGALSPGQPVYPKDILGVSGVEFTEEGLADCGHATMIRTANGWSLAFDFIYYKGLARRHIDAAREFLGSAEHAAASGWLNAFADTLFSAMELLAKARLLTLVNGPGEIQNHKAVHARVNRQSKIGNIETAHREAFNRLYEARRAARYLEGARTIAPTETESLLVTARGMLAAAEQGAGRGVPPRPAPQAS